MPEILLSNGVIAEGIAVLNADGTTATAGGGNSSFIGIVAAQVVAAGAASAASAVVQSTATRVILVPTVDCWVSVGDAPVAAIATTGSFFLPAGTPSYPIKVTGGVTKIAAIANVSAATGYLSVTEST